MNCGWETFVRHTERTRPSGWDGISYAVVNTRKDSLGPGRLPGLRKSNSWQNVLPHSLAIREYTAHGLYGSLSQIVTDGDNEIGINSCTSGIAVRLISDLVDSSRSVEMVYEIFCRYIYGVALRNEGCQCCGGEWDSGFASLYLPEAIFELCYNSLFLYCTDSNWAVEEMTSEWAKRCTGLIPCPYSYEEKLSRSVLAVVKRHCKKEPGRVPKSIIVWLSCITAHHIRKNYPQLEIIWHPNLHILTAAVSGWRIMKGRQLTVQTNWQIRNKPHRTLVQVTEFARIVQHPELYPVDQDELLKLPLSLKPDRWEFSYGVASSKEAFIPPKARTALIQCKEYLNQYDSLLLFQPRLKKQKKDRTFCEHWEEKTAALVCKTKIRLRILHRGDPAPPATNKDISKRSNIVTPLFFRMKNPCARPVTGVGSDTTKTPLFLCTGSALDPVETTGSNMFFVNTRTPAYARFLLEIFFDRCCWKKSTNSLYETFCRYIHAVRMNGNFHLPFSPLVRETVCSTINDFCYNLLFGYCTLYNFLVEEIVKEWSHRCTG